MKKLLPAVCAACALFTGGIFAADPAHPFQPPQRSISSSQEFVIYCDDKAMRLAISTFCEETKSAILQLLTQRDEWKVPIVINIFRPDATAPDAPLSEIHLYNVEGGTRKIELNVTLRGDLADIRFQQQIIRAILLEMEYRGVAQWREDAPFIQPPDWLVEGLGVYIKARDTEADSDVYAALLKNTPMPRIADFLSQSAAGMNASSMKIYQAYAYSFLQLIAGLQNGPQGLAWYIHDLPSGHDTPEADLIKHFPALGGSEENMEKWWTISMARIAAYGRYNGAGVEASEKQLAALLKFTIPTGKAGDPKEYGVEDFKDFVKNPKAGPVLAAAVVNLQRLSTEANPLFRPIVVAYMQVISDLQHRKTGRVEAQLKELAKFREMLVTRMDQIADYMNWFEATQIPMRSDSFQDYIKTAKQMSNEAPERDDAISRYLDDLETQMQ